MADHQLGPAPTTPTDQPTCPANADLETALPDPPRRQQQEGQRLQQRSREQVAPLTPREAVGGVPTAWAPLTPLARVEHRWVGHTDAEGQDWLLRTAVQGRPRALRTPAEAQSAREYPGQQCLTVRWADSYQLQEYSRGAAASGLPEWAGTLPLLESRAQRQAALARAQSQNRNWEWAETQAMRQAGREASRGREEDRRRERSHRRN